MNKIEFEQFIERNRAYYKTLGPVFCYALQRMVNFNSKGFYHLRYNGLGRERSLQEQTHRLTLLPLAISVIKKAIEVYRYEKRHLKHGRAVVEYWEINAIVGNNISIAVILRKVGNGEITFHSIRKN